MNNVLIITVGTSPEPVIFSLKKLQPEMVVYLCTGNEAGKKNGSIEYLDTICKEYGLSPSKMKCLEVRDSPSCIGDLCMKFYEGYRWLRNAGYSDEQIVCDPTAGRKWMSAAATMVASQLGLDMFYVDAKWDKGKVIENSMQVVSLGNPYEQTGFVEIERGRMLFNRYFYVSSGEIFSKLKERTHNSNVRDLYLSLEKISKTFQEWDNFAHYSRDIKPDFLEGINALGRYISSASNVPSELVDFKDKLLSMAELLDKVNELKRKFGSPEPDIKITVDLVKNAERRVLQGRYDDAVARLYRAFESIEQFLLWKNYGINAGRVSENDYKKLGDNYKTYKENFGCHGNISLDQGFAFLYLIGDNVANELVNRVQPRVVYKLISKLSPDKDVSDKKTGLEFRNSSILAHGFVPVSKEIAETFLSDMKKIVDVCYRHIAKEETNILWDKFDFPKIEKIL